MIQIANEDSYNELKDILKKSPSVKSQHKIIGEWNFNSIKDIEHFGVYHRERSRFIEGNGYTDGKAVLEYLTSVEESGQFVLDGETVENTIYNSFYSLYDCFLPYRPSAGVAYPMANSSRNVFRNNPNVDSAPITYINGIDRLDDLSTTRTPTVKNYLPHKDVKYKYWNSACYGVSKALVPGMTGVKNLDGTKIKNETFDDYEFVTKPNGMGKPHPFVVYDSDFYCNMVVIKYQTHLGVPNRFYIDVLQGDDWNQIFSSEDFIGSSFLRRENSDGVFKIFRDRDGSWTPLMNREYPKELIDFLVEGQVRYLPDGSTKLSSFADEAIKIRGVRLRVKSMTKSNAPFELVELSPRLVVDLTDYTLEFNCSTSVGDGTSALPTTNTVIGSGNITLSNTDGGFFNSNDKSILYNSLGKGVKIVPFQTFELPNGSIYQIPIKVLYTENWVESPDYSVSASLNDFMKVLQSQKCAPIMVSTLFKSVPVSFAVQTVLHSIGFTNFKFLDSETVASDNIKYFYADEEKTVAEVLDEIAKATHSSIYIDAFNNVVCATKDKVLDRSYKVKGKEPEWWLTTEDIKVEKVSAIGVDYTPSPQPLDTTPIPESSEVSSGNEPLPEEVTSSNDYCPTENAENEEDVPSYTPTVVGTLGASTSINPMIGEADIDTSSSPDYLSNIIAMTKDNTEVLNDGEIVYTTKTFQTKKAYSTKEVERISRQDPMKLVKQPYELKIQGLWSPSGNGDSEENSSDIVLFGGMILTRLDAQPLHERVVRITRTGFNGNASYPDFQQFMAAKVLNDNGIPPSKKLFKISPIDALWFLRPFSGYLRVNQEIIRYNGIEFSIGSKKRWIFNEDQLENFSATATPKRPLVATGRVGLWMEFDEENPIVDNNTGTVKYAVVDSGRGQFDTKVTAHEINKYQSNDTEYINGWEMEASYFCNSDIVASTKNGKKVNVHDIEKSKSKLILGSTNSNSIKDYSGAITKSGLYISGAVGKELSGENAKIKEIQKFVEQDIKDRKLEGDENYDNVLRIATTGDLIAQGIYKNFSKKYDTFYTSFTFLNKKGRTKKESVTTTTSAGMAVHYNKNTGEGYFVEISGTVVNEETDDVNAQVVAYKVKRSNNKNLVTILGRKVLKKQNIFAIDPVLGQISEENENSLSIRIKKQNSFTVYMDNVKILSVEDEKEKSLKATNDVLLFVRGDTVALFDNFVASSEPINNNSLFLYDKRNTTFKLTDDYYTKPSIVRYPVDAIYVDEFGDDIYQVKKFKFKYTNKPAPIYELADLTPVGADYFVEDYDLHAFGGEIIVSNSSGASIALSDQTKNAIMVLGVPLSDFAQQRLTVNQFISELPSNSKLKNEVISSVRKNGPRAFNLQSEYIQNENMARRVMSWMIKNSHKPKVTAAIDCFCNPLLELTDTVKIYSPRNNIDPNSYYSITSINYSISGEGPSLSVEVREID